LGNPDRPPPGRSLVFSFHQHLSQSSSQRAPAAGCPGEPSSIIARRRGFRRRAYSDLFPGCFLHFHANASPRAGVHANSFPYPPGTWNPGGRFGYPLSTDDGIRKTSPRLPFECCAESPDGNAAAIRPPNLHPDPHRHTASRHKADFSDQSDGRSLYPGRFISHGTSSRR